jgi:Protein of unknown function (DUF732)
MKTLTSALVTLSILVGFAPAARADASADYIAALNQNQISYSNSATALNIGNSICQQLHSNATPEVAAQAALNAGYVAKDAGKILSIASHTLCPDMGPAIDKWANS